jgi:hypothetical protein
MGNFPPMNSGGARANSIRVHLLVICLDLTYQGALMVDYRCAQTDFVAKCRVKT